MNFSDADITRFYSKLKRVNDCQLYQGGRSVYGQFSYVNQETGERSRMGSHRFAYILAFGPIPTGMFVLHQCDTPRCCNPTHLSLGTQMDNYLDMVKKERHPFFKSKERRKRMSKFKIDLFWIKRELKKKSS